jgi:hypothetical protein
LQASGYLTYPAITWKRAVSVLGVTILYVTNVAFSLISLSSLNIVFYSSAPPLPSPVLELHIKRVKVWLGFVGRSTVHPASLLETWHIEVPIQTVMFRYHLKLDYRYEHQHLFLDHTHNCVFCRILKRLTPMIVLIMKVIPPFPHTHGHIHPLTHSEYQYINLSHSLRYIFFLFFEAKTFP